MGIIQIGVEQRRKGLAKTLTIGHYSRALGALIRFFALTILRNDGGNLRAIQSDRIVILEIMQLGCLQARCIPVRPIQSHWQMTMSGLVNGLPGSGLGQSLQSLRVALMMNCVEA